MTGIWVRRREGLGAETLRGYGRVGRLLSTDPIKSLYGHRQMLRVAWGDDDEPSWLSFADTLEILSSEEATLWVLAQ